MITRVCVYIYIYIYIYTHTHTRIIVVTHTSNDCILMKMHESYRHEEIRKHSFILGFIYIYIYIYMRERESVFGKDRE